MVGLCLGMAVVGLVNGVCHWSVFYCWGLTIYFLMRERRKTGPSALFEY